MPSKAARGRDSMLNSGPSKVEKTRVWGSRAAAGHMQSVSAPHWHGQPGHTSHVQLPPQKGDSKFSRTRFPAASCSLDDSI